MRENDHKKDHFHLILQCNVIIGATIGYKYQRIYCFVRNVVTYSFVTHRELYFLRGVINLCVNAFSHAYKCELLDFYAAKLFFRAKYTDTVESDFKSSLKIVTAVTYFT